MSVMWLCNIWLMANIYTHCRVSSDSRVTCPYVIPVSLILAPRRYTYVQTGDINLMWTRDSAVQIAIYMPRMTRIPAIRLVVEGVIRY